MNAATPEMETQIAPPQAVLMQMTMSYIISQAISVAAKLYVADHLKDGAKSAAELAELTSAHAPSLYRLMRALTSAGVFGKDAEGKFINTQMSEFLRSDHPESMRNAAHMICDREHWNSHGNMLQSVKTGENAFEYTFGMPVFPYFAQNPEAAKVFDDSMTSFSGVVSNAVAAAYDFSGAKTIADIGGGHGHLLETVLKYAPDAKGILFDQPQVLKGANVSERAEKIGGDFFAGIPVEADIYMLKWIIHDWNDEQSETILNNLAESAEPGAKVLLVEIVVEEDDAIPSISKIMDLNMLSMTGGKERTEKEYAALFEKTGFRLINVIPTQSAMQIVEAVRI